MKLMTVVKVLVVLVLCVVGLGFYQGWFVLSSNNSPSGDNKMDVNLTVDPDKAKEDANAVGAKIRDLTGRDQVEKPENPPESSEVSTDKAPAISND